VTITQLRNQLLLVEDDSAWAALTREAFLEVAPEFRIEVAPDGGTAVARLEEPDAPAIVLLDLNMPGTDGREVLRAIGKLPEGGKPTVVVLSASVSSRDRALAAELGAVAYVTKPTTFTALCQMAEAIAEDRLDELNESAPPGALSDDDPPPAPTITNPRVAFVSGHDPSMPSRLLAAGFDVHAVASVDDLPGLMVGPIDCIVLDLDAPGARRNEAVRAASAIASGVPIVAIGGKATEAGELATLAAGAADVVSAGHATQEVLQRTIRFAVERTALSSALSQQQRFLDAVLDSVDAAIVACDAGGHLRIVNAAAEVLHGRPADPRLPSQEWATAYQLVDMETGTYLTTSEVPLARALAGERVDDAEVGVVDATGAVRRCVVRGQPLRDADGAALGAVVVFHDVTEQRRLEGALSHMAMHDPLTGLPNRRLTLDRIGHAIDRNTRGPGATAVLYIDLDRFKEVNDRDGHAAGDAQLKVVAERLLVAVRPGDTVGRLGGDEFVVVAEALPDTEAALALADRVHAALRDVTASIGIVLVRVPRDVDDVLRDADAAMYVAKRSGGGRSQVAAIDRSVGHAS